MDISRRLPIGIELVRKGVITEEQVNAAVEYQKSHRKMKLGEILREITECDEKVYKSARNIKGVTPTYVDVLNTYEILKHDKFIIAKDAIAKIEEVLA